MPKAIFHYKNYVKKKTSEGLFQQRRKTRMITITLSSHTELFFISGS